MTNDQCQYVVGDGDVSLLLIFGEADAEKKTEKEEGERG
jgi:hypothetical protein